MSRRLLRILKENHGLILHGVVRSLRASGTSYFAGFSFDELYQVCDTFLDGYIDLVGISDPQRLQRLFSLISDSWARRGFDLSHARKIFSALRSACTPILESSHTPQTRARLKLDMECYLSEVITLFTLIYHNALVESTKEESRAFELIFRETEDCIYSMDAEGSLRIMNPAMERFLGVTCDEVRGKKCHELLQWKDKEKCNLCKERCVVIEAFKSGENSCYYEGQLRIKKSNKRWVGTTASCVRDEAGNIKEVVCVMRDITSLKEKQWKLEEEIRTFETLALSTQGIELRIPCLSEFAVTARAQAELIAKRMRFKEDRIQDIKSAVGEACDNAIEHSNSPNGVDIRYRLRGTNLMIEVEDYGEGFDPESIGHSLPSPYIEGGRGLYLIKNLTDEVRIVSRKGQGTKITMEIFRKPMPYRSWKTDRTWKSEKKIAVM